MTSISIIIPCHNEEHNISELYKEVVQVLILLGNPYEIIFVNDGSKDNTVAEIKKIIQLDKNVKLLSLATNYGHQVALLMGLKKCKNDIAISLDADLQHPPRYFPDLLKQQQDTKALVVDAVRAANTQKGFLKKLFSNLFYPLFRFLTGIHIEPGVADFRLYTRPVINALMKSEEQTPFIRGKISEMRLPRAFVNYEMGDRYAGSPAYTMKKSFFMAYNSLMDYSKLPYRVGLIVSVVFMMLAFIFSLMYLYLRLFTDEYIKGNTDIIVLICLGFSFLLFITGIILRQLTTITYLLKGKHQIIIDEES